MKTEKTNFFTLKFREYPENKPEEGEKLVIFLPGGDYVDQSDEVLHVERYTAEYKYVSFEKDTGKVVGIEDDFYESDNDDEVYVKLGLVYDVENAFNKLLWMKEEDWNAYIQTTLDKCGINETFYETEY